MATRRPRVAAPGAWRGSPDRLAFPPRRSAADAAGAIPGQGIMLEPRRATERLPVSGPERTAVAWGRIVLAQPSAPASRRAPICSQS